jgi:hypothetical protein
VPWLYERGWRQVSQPRAVLHYLLGWAIAVMLAVARLRHRVSRFFIGGAALQSCLCCCGRRVCTLCYGDAERYANNLMGMTLLIFH